jgi:GNAT superfamily N-acetyltransferase
MESANLVVAEPQSDSDWIRYYDLRWRILRAPWNQPRGSERDEYESDSVHLMLSDASGDLMAVGRVHLLSSTEAQVRYMAVEPEWQGRGLGARILSELEARAQARGAARIVLNARREVVPFYLRHGYRVIGEAETLFGVVEHVRMEKCFAGSENDVI